MPSPFDALCKDARELISVPAVPLVAIRHGAEFRDVPASRKRGNVTVLLAGCAILAVAATAEFRTHISFDRSGAMTMFAHRLVIKDNPTQQDVLAAAGKVDFPVVLPAGLPGSEAPTALISGPSAIALEYNLPGAWRASNHLLDIVLANSSALGPAPKREKGDYEVMFGGMAAQGKSVHWIVGGEEVFVLHSTITPAELAHIKRAMLAEARSH